MQEYNVAFITCGYKPYNVDMYQLQVPTTKDIYGAIESMCVRLLKSGRTVLVFLPGKAEIDAMETALLTAKVNSGDIDILHSELPVDKIDRAITPRDRPRLILSTNVAEKAVTIGDVDVVLDSGIARDAVRWPEYVEMCDYLIDPFTHRQRSGRVGRTEDGASIFFQPKECNLPQGKLVSSESILRVVAQQSFPKAITPSACKLCPVSKERIVEAEQTIKALGLTKSELSDALGKVSLDLCDAAVLLRAKEWGVAYEAAARPRWVSSNPSPGVIVLRRAVGRAIVHHGLEGPPLKRDTVGNVDLGPPPKYHAPG